MLDFRSISERCIFAFAAVLVFSAPAAADSCFLSPAKMSDQAVEGFKSNPGFLLSANPAGGYGLSSQVRSVAGSDTDSVATLVGLAEGANDTQVAALGAGLAQAATACVSTRPDVAELIQQAVAESGNEALIAAFAAASGDTQTAALGPVGGTGGAGGGAAGGLGGTSATAGAAGESSSVTNSSFSLAATNATGGVSTTVEQTSVSPN